MSHAAPTLDDLNTLNTEIIALTKAGIPLELGLQHITKIKKSELTQLAARISQRLSEGRTLPQAISAEGPAVSPVYAAVMNAGLSSGQLPEALESVVASGQIIQETRRRIWLALLYPLICLVVAFFIFNFVILSLPTRFIAAGEMLTPGYSFRFMRQMQEHAIYFRLYLPLALLAIVAVIYLLRTSLTRGLWEFLTSFRWAIGQSLNWSQFCDLLALQIEHGVPLHQAFVQAADSTNDQLWQKQARQVAEHLQAGKCLAEALQVANRLPPVVRWMLASGEKQGHLAVTLRQLTDLYRRQSLRRAAIVKIWVPVTMTLVFTLTVGLTYGLAFVLPLRAFLLELMKE